MAKTQESDSKGKEATKKTAKAPKERALSNEALATKLLKEKADEATILAAFTKVYKDKKGVTDKKFVEKRIKIYMSIASKRVKASK